MDRFKGIYRIESARLETWDYTSPAWYFVTICTKGMEEWFGEVDDGEMKCNDVGEIAYRMFMDIPNHHKNVRLDEFVIMPNHIHWIIILCGNHGGYKYCWDGESKHGRDVACNVSTNAIATAATICNSVHMSTISTKSGSLGSVVVHSNQP